jgi:PAS domain S-box-containing protein
MGAFPKPEDIRQPAPVKEVLRRVIDTIPCLVTRSRPDGYVDFVNQRWREFTGLKLEDVLGWGWRAVLHPQDVEKYMRKWRAALSTGEPFEHEARLRRHDGEYRWFLIRKLPLRDAGGNIVSWYGTSHDVEDLKETTEKLRQSETELRQIIDVIPAHVFVLESDASSFIEGRFLPNRQALEYTGLTLQQVRSDPTRIFHPEDAKKLRALRQASLAKEMPFESEARVRRRDGQYRWFLIRVNPLKDDSGRILRWYGTRTDIEDQKRAEDHLRLVIETIPQQIWSAPGEGSPDFSLDFCNAQWRSYTGLTPEELQGEGWQRILHPDDRERVLKAWRESVAAGKPFEQEVRRRGADGKYRWFLGRGVPLKDAAGRIVRWYGTNTDIEDRKEAENHLRLVIDTIPQQIWSCAPDGSLDFFNAQWLSYRGLTQEEAVNGGWQRMLHPDDRDRVLKAWRESVMRGTPFEMEARVRAADGQYRWFLARAVPLKDSDGPIVRWYGTNTDIEDRRKAEVALRQSEQRWRAIFENASVGVTLLDASLHYVTVNGTFEHMLGYTSDELRSRTCVELTVEEDQLRYKAFIDELLQGKRDHFEVEKRFRRKDGSQVWTYTTASLVEGTHGESRLWVAIVENITERKRLRDQLERERDRLRLLLDLSNVFVPKLSLSDFFDAFAEGLREIEGWEYSFVALPESVSSLTVHLVGGSTGELKAGTIVPIEGTFVGDAYRSGQFKFFRVADLHPVPHYPELTSWREFARAQGLQVGCNLPLHYEGKVLGVLGFHTRNDMERAREDLGFLQELAKLVALALHNALRYGELSQSHDALRESEDRLRLVVDATPALLYSARPDGYLDFFNKRWLDYLGRSLEDLTGWGWTSAIHPDDLEDLEGKWRTALATGQPYKTEARVRRADGEYHWMLLRKVPLRDQAGNIVKWYGSGIDVEEQHEARAALQKAFNEIKALRDQLYKENLVLKDQIGQASGFEEMIGASAALRSVLILVEKVAVTDSTVLITGETGTGKELVARAIHKRSNRAPQAFISVNCSAIPASLVASELFGYEKGAFTGAVERRLGRFELADGGTVFLDEIGDLPAETQISLLRVLQERTFERVGGSQPISVDVRVLAATHRDLHAAVEAGTFRQDLFYRLNVFPIHVPPLRDRVEDIPLLVRYFAEQYAKKAGKKIKNIKRKTLEILQAYDWPGNIRELQNVIERAVILCDGDTLAVDEEWLQSESPRSGVAARGLGRLDENREREIIESALRETRGRVSGIGGAAAKLGIPRSTLESRIRKLQIDKQRFTSG